MCLQLEWDTDPGVQEVQTVKTNVYLGPNEVQSITTSATVIPEVQTVGVFASKIREVQRITVSQATAGYFFVELDTSSLGGSVQYSGYIEPNYPPDSSPDGRDVASVLSAMSNIKVNGVVQVSKLTIDASNFAYLVTFPESMGNVPLMKVHTGALTPKGTASADISTEAEGNVVSGSFRLSFGGETTESLSSQATASEVRQALEALNTVGEVVVERSAIDNQMGYRWTVTFISSQNSGNVAPLAPDYSALLVTNPTGTVLMNVSSIDGNQLGGSFTLDFQRGVLSQTSAPIAFDASASAFKAALEAMGSNIIPPGTISVARTGPDEQLGYSWTVTFLDDYYRTFYGNQSPFVFSPAGLTGSGAGGTVREVFQGTFQEVQQITVTKSTAGAIAAPMVMDLTFSGQTTIPILVSPPNGTCDSNVVEVQEISTTTVDTTTAGGDYDVSMYLQFRLTFGNKATSWINANPNANTNCATTSAEIKSALEALDAFHTVSVSGVSTSSSQTCKWQVSFVSSIGDLQQLQVQSRNPIAGSVGSIGASSVASDDTVSVRTVQDGQKDAIKFALESLSNVGIVTVTPVSASQGSKGECSWKVTFDSNAGNLPLLQARLRDNVASVTFSTLSSSTTLSGVTVAVTEVTAGTSTAINGNFALTFRGARSYYLPFDASARDVKDALESLSTVGQVGVTRSSADENFGYVWTVTFLTELGSLDLLVFDNEDMTGTMVNGVVSKLVAGITPPFNSLSFGSNLPLGSTIITNLTNLAFSITNLDEGIAYYVRVAAINAIGQGPYAFSAVPYALPMSQRPGRPVNSQLNALDGSSLSVTFQSPNLDGGQDVTFYKVSPMRYGIRMISESLNLSPPA